MLDYAHVCMHLLWVSHKSPDRPIKSKVVGGYCSNGHRVHVVWRQRAKTADRAWECGSDALVGIACTLHSSQHTLTLIECGPVCCDCFDFVSKMACEFER